MSVCHGHFRDSAYETAAYFLLSCLLCEFRCYQILIRNPLRQLSGFLQNVFQKLKAFFLEYGVILPGILVLITAYDDSEFIHRCFFKLGLYGFGYFFG